MNAFFFYFTVLWMAALLATSALANEQYEELTGEYVEFELPVAPQTALERARGIEKGMRQEPPTFNGYLQLPENADRSPAIVLVQTCHGRQYYQDWLNRFKVWGYVTLSFSRCSTKNGEADDLPHSTLDWKRGASIAFGALEYLSTRSEVDADRVAIMGWSRPAMTPLSVLNYEGFSQFFDLQFKTAIAVYPFCSFARGPHRAPVLIVSAQRDDYVNPIVCKRISKSSHGDEYPIKLAILEGAFHGFDIPMHGKRHWAERAEINPDGYSAGGGTLAYEERLETQLVDLVKSHLKAIIGD